MFTEAFGVSEGVVVMLAVFVLSKWVNSNKNAIAEFARATTTLILGFVFIL